jgi:hypothetical protein
MRMYERENDPDKNNQMEFNSVEYRPVGKMYKLSIEKLEKVLEEIKL